MVSPITGNRISTGKMIPTEQTGLTEAQGFWGNSNGVDTVNIEDWQNLDQYTVSGISQGLIDTFKEVFDNAYGMFGTAVMTVTQYVTVDPDEGTVDVGDDIFNPNDPDDGSTGEGGNTTNPDGEQTSGGSGTSGGGTGGGTDDTTTDDTTTDDTTTDDTTTDDTTTDDDTSIGTGDGTTIDTGDGDGTTTPTEPDPPAEDDVITTGIREAVKYNQSMLSHQLKIQDLQYYSDYSYEIRSNLDMSTWGPAFENFAHPAGLKFYGKKMDSPNDLPF
jgi:hypothetical protein